MRKIILAGLMAATAFTPMAPAIAQVQLAQRDDNRGERHQVREERREERRDDRQNRQVQRRDDRREVRMDRRENRPERRVERRTEARPQIPQVQRSENRTSWREVGQNARRDRGDDRRDWRDNRRGDRRDWRDDRRDDRRGRVENRWSDQRRWNSGWRNDRRYDWRRYRQTNRHFYRMPRYYAPHGWSHGYSRFSIGIYLGGPLYGRSYWIDDPWYYRLPPAYGSLRWIRYYDDALLVDIRDGYVVDVIYGFFY